MTADFLTVIIAVVVAMLAIGIGAALALLLAGLKAGAREPRDWDHPRPPRRLRS
ncbi:MAG: hypothetical protein AB7F22_10445 [Reyranella sp.]|uniref:hypothetical protein n=1 Tax=Reyranella sp. TaxID=1929291 RepID=UPI003D09B113